MTESEVNLKVKEWILSQTFHYKGILNTGKGQVPAPDGNRQVLIDHQGVKDNPIDLMWVEAKGSNSNFSQLLEGFIRVQYAVWHGGGVGYLAIPNKEYELLLEQEEFLRAISGAVNGKGLVGLLDIEKGRTIVF